MAHSPEEVQGSLLFYNQYQYLRFFQYIYCYILFMKQILTTLSIVFIHLMSSPSWSETLGIDDLVKNPGDGLIYKKFSTAPFSGSVSPTSEYPSRGSFKDGKRHGLWETFHQNGLISSRGNYNNGKLVGIWKYYDQSGVMKQDEDYGEGLSETYHENGQISQKGNYKDGNYEGLWMFYHENGKLRKKGNFKDGKQVGLLEQYEMDGQLRLKVYVNEDGSYEIYNGDGPTKTYIDEGVVGSEGTYENNLKTGLWKTYHKNGELWAKGTYKESKKVNQWKSFDENGNLRTIKLYNEAGIRHGDWSFYDEEGSLTKTQIWVNGKLTKKISHD